ncbi:UNVERIFIED_CONTAM: hypothetical protein GTU68_007047 [Idotea baltica]|nr:hypothetical protein [Idotea baltica]
MMSIGNLFNIHELALEDIVNVPHRPKIEVFDDSILLIVRMVRVDGGGQIDMEQVSVVLGKNFVITFQEKSGDVFDPVRKRIRSGDGPIHEHGADFLAYAIVDTIIDAYYPALEMIGDLLEPIETKVVFDPTPNLLNDLNQLKKHLFKIRRAISPQREAIGSMYRDEHDLVSKEVQVYLRDTYDHCVHTAEVTELYREMIGGLMNTYLTSVANKTNEVMKVLTIVATVFIPLTFLAGIYGMNFEHMPELKWQWAYPTFWLVIVAMGTAMLWFFWRNGWIKFGRSNDIEIEQ